MVWLAWAHGLVDPLVRRAPRLDLGHEHGIVGRLVALGRAPAPGARHEEDDGPDQHGDDDPGHERADCADRQRDQRPAPAAEHARERDGEQRRDRQRHASEPEKDRRHSPKHDKFALSEIDGACCLP